MKFENLYKAIKLEEKMKSAKMLFDRQNRLLSSDDENVIIKILVRVGYSGTPEYEETKMKIKDSPEAKRILADKRNKSWSEYVGYRTELRLLGVDLTND